MNEKIFFLILSQKVIFRVMIKCNNIFVTNIISREHPTKLNKHGN